MANTPRVRLTEVSTQHRMVQARSARPDRIPRLRNRPHLATIADSVQVRPIMTSDPKHIVTSCSIASSFAPSDMKRSACQPLSSSKSEDVNIHRRPSFLTELADQSSTLDRFELDPSPRKDCLWSASLATPAEKYLKPEVIRQVAGSTCGPSSSSRGSSRGCTPARSRGSPSSSPSTGSTRPGDNISRSTGRSMPRPTGSTSRSSRPRRT